MLAPARGTKKMPHAQVFTRIAAPANAPIQFQADQLQHNKIYDYDS